ncbi:unnamed protein product [Somion occarium]|uniref:NADH dehydrogenase [ubiquinone] 1 alpha subcomplex subunit 12 n=1 Tax=Somion occarium TaxID=3059160 RepID=A0ABP1CXU5_9APHY
MSVSVFRRLWAKISNPTKCVGRDLEGNRYFEYPNPHGDVRTKRVVKYRRGYDMWTYIAGEKRLPVQWTSWLTHTRSHPPTYQELLADLERQRRVLQNAAMIEAREREAREAAQLASPSHAPTQSPENTDTTSEAPSVQASSSPNARSGVSADQTPTPSKPQHSTEPSKPDPWEAARAKADGDQPQSWAPRAVRRGG